MINIITFLFSLFCLFELCYVAFVVDGMKQPFTVYRYLVKLIALLYAVKLALNQEAVWFDLAWVLVIFNILSRRVYFRLQPDFDRRD